MQGVVIGREDTHVVIARIHRRPLIETPPPLHVEECTSTVPHRRSGTHETDALVLAARAAREADRRLQFAVQVLARAVVRVAVAVGLAVLYAEDWNAARTGLGHRETAEGRKVSSWIRTGSTHDETGIGHTLMARVRFRAREHVVVPEERVVGRPALGRDRQRARCSCLVVLVVLVFASVRELLHTIHGKGQDFYHGVENPPEVEIVEPLLQLFGDSQEDAEERKQRLLDDRSDHILEHPAVHFHNPLDPFEGIVIG